MTPRGIRNNNPLNIRKGNDWHGERHPQTDKEFEEFQSLELGLRAGFILIHNYMKKRPPLNTVELIVSRWAPPTENATLNYIRNVCKRSGLQPNVILRWQDKNVMCRLIWAMCWQECGCEVSFGRIENAYEMAKR